MVRNRFLTFCCMLVALRRAVLRFAEIADLLGLGGLLGQEHGLDVGQNSTLGDGDAGQEFVQLLVIADGELQVTGDDPRLLVVTGGVSCQLENLGGEVLHDGGQVDWGTGTDTLGIVSFPQEPVDTSNRELETGTGAPGLALSLGFSSFTTARHVYGLMIFAARLSKERMLKFSDFSFIYATISELRAV